MSDSLPMPIPAQLTPAQRTQIINLIRRTARAEILPRFRTLGQADIDQKTGPMDVVTAADREAEKMIVRGLLQLFPNAHIVGEETATEEKIAGLADAEMGFTIDPVDGTWNFAHGLATFGVILSMTRFGTPVFGLIYDPITDEVLVADETDPAQVLAPRRPARVVHVSKGGPIEALSGFVSLYSLPEDKRATMAALMTRFRYLYMLRCAAHEFRMVAQGHTDFVLCANLTPWDHAAGALLVKRAGGHVACLDGSEYRADMRSGYLLCASDAATWGRVRDSFAFLLEPASDAPA
ncbi:inositol monophosphatase [Marivita sp. S6314]|uniref:inositol monophosphatase family protein n=1 Tax=Marivita sp. S6314 TaxID=2926406 RepID=UPI001FF14C7D|nr:inositol monophosphatase [Marivita sp. S6314]MCK0149794.1 inositol monophosphatase [Marivita sp. S6314]